MPIRSGAKGVVAAAVLMGLIAGGPASPALAQQPNDQPELPAGPAAWSIRHPEAGRHATVVLRPVPSEPPLDAAIRALFCQEARDALREGRSNAALLDWILTNAHACRDDRLLVDAFGFWAVNPADDPRKK